MINIKDNIKKKANLLYILLTTILIWMGIIGIAVFWAWVFDGEYFSLRIILLYPFAMIGIYTTQWIWWHYNLH